MERTPHQAKRNLRDKIQTPTTVQDCTKSFNLGPKQNDAWDHLMESLQELLKRTWNIWGVSCLYGFQPDELQLKLYAKRLREEVAAALPHDDVTYDAKFDILESMENRPRLDDHPPIKVEVFSSPVNETEVKKNIYTGIFLSWRSMLAETSNDNTTKLPLLLCRGTKSAMKAVHMVIGHMFDCQIVSLPATEDDLEWLIPLMLNSIDHNTHSENKGQIRLEYRIPGLPVSDTIAVTLNISALTKLWTTICEDGNDESETEYFIKADRVLKFHQVLKTQVLSVSSLQLGLCVLNKINMPFFTIMDNRMKADSADAMHRFLLFFNDRSLKSLHTLDYDTTATINSDTFTS